MALLGGTNIPTRAKYRYRDLIYPRRRHVITREGSQGRDEFPERGIPVIIKM